MDNLLYYKSQNAHIRAYENEIKQQELNTQYQIAQNKIIREGERNLLTSAQIMQQLSDLYNNLIASKKEIGKIIPFSATEKSALPTDQSVRDNKADVLTQKKLTFEKKIKNKNASKIQKFVKAKKDMSDIDASSSQADTASSIGDINYQNLASISSSEATKKLKDAYAANGIRWKFNKTGVLSENNIISAFNVIRAKDPNFTI